MFSVVFVVSVGFVLVSNVCVAWMVQTHVRRFMNPPSVRFTGGRAIGGLIPRHCATKADFPSQYTYFENGVEYDVPCINEPKWYRLLVRKNSEGTVFEALTTQIRTTGKGNLVGKVVDAYYPQKMLLKFKGKKQTGDGLAAVAKAMIPGLVFVRTTMNAEVADMIEGIDGVRGFLKGRNGRVAPLSESELSELDVLRSQQFPELDEEARRLRIGDYVSIVGGRHTGRYGIIEGASDGKIQVCLRSEYRDSHDVIDVRDLRHLPAPPETHHLNMTAKEAVEALLIKEPNGEMLRFLRKEGLLNQILHPERSNGRSRDGYRYGREEQRQGREGGRSQRSVAVEDRPEPSTVASTLSFTAAADVDGDSPVEQTPDDKDRFVAGEWDAEQGPVDRDRDVDAPSGASIDLSQFSSFDEYLAALVDSKRGLTSSAGSSDSRPRTKNARNPGEGYASKTLSELKDLCRRNGLPVSGTKAELITRLSAR